MEFKDCPDYEYKIKEVTDTIERVLPHWDSKRATIFLNWLNNKLEYLESEECYAPKEDNYYKRRQVVHVDLGLNVGSEEGGPRFAIVLWAPQSSKTMTIVPLTSQKTESQNTNSELHVNLGELLTQGMTTIAKVEQIRAVSKMRVSRIKKHKYKTDRVPGPLLDEINKAIKIYTEKR